MSVVCCLYLLVGGCIKRVNLRENVFIKTNENVRNARVSIKQVSTVLLILVATVDSNFSQVLCLF